MTILPNESRKDGDTPVPDLSCAQLAATADALLTLQRRIAGIRFLHSDEEYEQAAATHVRPKVAYCVVVKAAMMGRSLKLAASRCGCNGASRALGFAPPTEEFFDGRLYQNFGLYRDLETCRQVAGGMTYCRKPCRGILAKPLERYVDETPDVVILATDARNAMRFVQGYTYHHGSQPVLKMAGNQALCSECTAHPLELDQLNLSMLCSGTRYLARWKEHELAIGIPYGRFARTVDGLLKTADAVELDPAKTSILKALFCHGLATPDFRFGHTYYTALEQKKGRPLRQQR